MTKIKICGLMRPADIEAVCKVRPDFAGSILTPGFRRSVAREQYREMNRMLADAGILRVGVFVNEPLRSLTGSFAEMLDLIQLHGDEDADYIAKLRGFTGAEIIKMFRLRSPADADAVNRSTADYVLLDSGTGTGKVFDWSLLSGITRPYFLAGGLTPENVGDAVRLLHPFAADVSSGVETDGRKDPEKIRQFAEIIRRTE